MAVLAKSEASDSATSVWRVFRENRIFKGIGMVGLVLVLSLAIWGPQMAFPTNVGPDTGLAIDDAVNWITREGDWLFGWVSDTVTRILQTLKDWFLWMPWPAVVAGVGVLGWGLAGRLLAFFSVSSLILLGFMGIWESAMETLALIGTAVIISIAIALPIGVVASRSDLLDSIIRPVLDAMQTLPSFVYLVPAVMFFSLGNVPAVMATVIYAVPPAIRLTNLGIRQVSPDVLESSRSFGTTSSQLLFKVQIPLALPTIMAGINQTTMMALAMAVIASMVGAGGLGEDVLRGLGQQRPGDSLISGLGIVVIAIIIDRITQGLTRGRQKQLQARGE